MTLSHPLDVTRGVGLLELLIPPPRRGTSRLQQIAASSRRRLRRTARHLTTHRILGRSPVRIAVSRSHLSPRRTPSTSYQRLLRTLTRRTPTHPRTPLHFGHVAILSSQRAERAAAPVVLGVGVVFWGGVADASLRSLSCRGSCAWLPRWGLWCRSLSLIGTVGNVHLGCVHLRAPVRAPSELRFWFLRAPACTLACTFWGRNVRAPSELRF